MLWKWLAELFCNLLRQMIPHVRVTNRKSNFFAQHGLYTAVDNTAMCHIFEELAICDTVT